MPEPTEAHDAPEEVHGRLVSGVALPEDPGIEELARDWTLSEADIGEVLLCRGTDNCLRFALQLCVLRRYGRFRVAATMLQIFTLTYYTQCRPPH
jgi:Domain of unknown function (DUF4158)